MRRASSVSSARSAAPFLPVPQIPNWPDATIRAWLASLASTRPQQIRIMLELLAHKKGDRIDPEDEAVCLRALALCGVRLRRYPRGGVNPHAVVVVH